MNQIELNQKLYNECIKKEVNKEKIIELLKNGANPLGSISNQDKYEYLYNELIYNGIDDNLNLYELTNIFIENGMKINNKNYIEDSGNNINPLWEFAFFCNSMGLKVLKLLLDNNLDYESAEILVDHIYTDFIFLDDIHDDELEYDNQENYECAMKMLLLCGSYDYILDKSKYIQDMIRLDINNRENLDKIKKYDTYYMKEEQNSNDYKRILYFYDKNTNKLIWTLDYKNNW